MDQRLIFEITVWALGVVGSAIGSWFALKGKAEKADERAAVADQKAAAAHARVDRLIEGTNGRPGILDRLTMLEEGRRTDRVELLRVRDTAHSTVGSLGALVGYTDHALDIVGDAIGQELPRPKAILLKRAPDQGDQGA